MNECQGIIVDMKTAPQEICDQAVNLLDGTAPHRYVVLVAHPKASIARAVCAADLLVGIGAALRWLGEQGGDFLVTWAAFVANEDSNRLRGAGLLSQEDVAAMGLSGGAPPTLH